jgi:drug/metabolite transporter (DMT)-like permease
MSDRVKADLALAFCTLIWGATFVVVKNALADASVFAFMGARFVLAAALMAIMYSAALRKLDRPALWAGALIGVFLFAGYAFQTVGLKFTSPSKAAFITGSSVVLVPVLLAGFGGRRINGWVWAGVLAALAGLYFLTVPPSGLPRLNKGDIITMGCAVMFALHIILVARYSARHSVAALSFLQVATTAALTALALPLLAATKWEPPRIAWTGNFIWAVLITAVGATAICFSLQVWAQQHTSPAHTAILLSLEPVFAGLTSFVVSHERLGGRALTGAALVFAGILLAELKGPTQAAADSPGPVSQIDPN